ncbi:MAG: 3-methyl-2-oxobutanoate hydroxymethyltransferase [Elusimicrobia bacterium]|nr:3-methyl-2-oxobutanoate hydroxymethyltransferase [Elusimicrobiota bacterium]
MTIKITPEKLIAKKAKRKTIFMTTAYSYSMAKLLDSTRLADCLLVADAVGVDQLGYSNALAVTLDEMLHHVKAVSHAKSRAIVVAEMPYLTYEVLPSDAAKNAGRLHKEGSADAVMVRGGEIILPSVKEILQANVPVMACLDFKSLARQFGKKAAVGDSRMLKLNEARRAAKSLEEAGCFALVLENMPAALAREITGESLIPTIGLKSGPYCDGQLVFTEDLLGKRFPGLVRQAIAEFARNFKKA